MTDSADNMISLFIEESREGLAGIEGELLTIEADGDEASVDQINRVFRTVHSMKGAAGFLGLKSIGDLAHAAENVLSLMRSKELSPSPETIEPLLKAIDRLREFIDDVEQSNEISPEAEIKLLEAITRRLPAASKTTLSTTSSNRVPGVTDAIASSSKSSIVLDKKLIDHAHADGLEVFLLQFDLTLPELIDRPLNELIEQINDMGSILATSADLEQFLLVQADASSVRSFEVALATVLDAESLARFFEVPSSSIQLVHPSMLIEPEDRGECDSAGSLSTSCREQSSHLPESSKAKSPTSAEKSTAGTASADTSIRVSVNVLDRLMNLAGELVLSRNQLMQIVAVGDRKAIDSSAHRINHVTSELQEAIMQTRMQPIGNVLQRFGRVVRDLSGHLGKQCKLEIEGGEVELDKTIVEAIGDPLTHLIRNAVDHGIESSAVRQANNKPVIGTILIKAFHKDGKVNLTISDDGAGIDASRIRQKAVEKGVITAEQAEAMSDREAVRLIFHAGFSTADEVSEYSGRGVGMDVVKTNFERLGGTVDISTNVGAGTTFSIRLPLTLAIIPSLIVHCGPQRYALPQANIEELVRINSREIVERIQHVQGADVLKLRGALLPLVRLSEVLEMPSSFEDWSTGVEYSNRRITLADRRRASELIDSETDARSNADRRDRTLAGALNIVVLSTGQLRYGLVVDSLQDSEEIVVKPLCRHLQDCRCLAGATVLGDGCIAMILDVGGIASHSGMDRIDDQLEQNASESVTSNAELVDVLLFRNSPEEQFGIPMSSIARIERVPVGRIDSVADREVLQYHGGTLELVRTEQVIKAKPCHLGQWAYIIVFRACGREMGLITPQILDTRSIPAHWDTQMFLERGILGSTSIEGKVTRLIDTFGLVETVRPEWIKDAGLRKEPHEELSHKRILVAEDSDFFRKRVLQMLKEEGYEATGFCDGQAAWEELCQSADQYDIVITDIEMPRLNGFQLCQKIRHSKDHEHLPVVAVTSLSSEEDQAKGKSVGLTRYLVKIDREELLRALADISRTGKGLQFAMSGR